MLEKKYARGNVPLDGGKGLACLDGWMVAAERDDPVCQLFTVSKKPTINLQDAEDDNFKELRIDHIDFPDAYDVYKDV